MKRLFPKKRLGHSFLKRSVVIPMAALICFVLLFACTPNAKKQEYIRNSGRIHGTFYNAVYLHPEGKDLQEKIEARMRAFELSLSTFKPNSIISRINQNDESVRTDSLFNAMYRQAYEVSTNTNGAFDITVAPLVNAWGFGFGNNDRSTTPDVAAILPFVGFRTIQLVQNRLIKSDPRTMLDASAIAKGQSVDEVARLFEEHGVEHFMIEIGGEVVTKGLNPDGRKWQIGIDKPINDPLNQERELQAIISMSGVGLATSGNYRQFYIRDGQKFAHTIDPRTGYPVNHNLLSATVIASSCMKADAYATAFMVLGVDSSMLICNQIADLECYLIFSNEAGAFEVVYTPGFKKYLNE